MQYNYSFEILKKNGSTLSFSVSADSEIKARLKAKLLSKQMGGKIKSYQKIAIPYESKDKKVNELNEALFFKN
jgi:hypothetical protein